MAESVITARRLFVGGFDLTGDLNTLGLTHTIEGQDKTRFLDTERTEMPGLIRTQLEASGLFDVDGVDEPDDVIPPQLRVADQIITVGMDAGAAGQRCEFFRAGYGNYRRGGQIGQPFTFDLSAFLTNAASVPGTIMHNGAVTGTSNGTGFQLGAVPAGKRLYAAAHVLSTGGSAELVINCISDDNSGFTSATNRGTILSQIPTVVGSAWFSVAGAITDDWWRISYVVTGGGSPVVAVSFGIL